MLKNQNIICISSIDWDFNWQGHQEIMWAFAKNGNKVLFIENTGVRAPALKDAPRLWRRLLNWRKGVMGIRKEEENLYIFSPVAVPFPFSRIARWINRYLFISSLKAWIKVMEFSDPIVWTFLPTGTALEIIRSIDKKLVVYYCIADFEELVKQPKKVQRAEKQLLKTCDLVFAQGEEIADRCKRFNKNVTIFPFGVSVKLFEGYHEKKPEIVPEDIKVIKKPIIGYVGALHKHFDFELTEYIVRRNPDLSFVFVGPLVEDTARLRRFKNVFFTGEKKHSALPDYINTFDVCLIPYNMTKYTSTVYPTKLNEYLIMGKPVVSVALSEVERFNSKYPDIVLVARSKEEFNACIRQALTYNNLVLTQRRIETARVNSWENRVSEMILLMEESIRQKDINREGRWQDLLLSFYHKARVRFFEYLFTAAILYGIIFYTPFVWWLAGPLKITQNLDKADAIVVLAGGVGESGRAGQGYEERVKYAVELYKKNYAENLIFSSGYRYIFREPIVMRALAISLGIPENAIILEEKASNTFENVNNVGKILADKGWNKIILVSSPYHMLRAYLVFHKNLPQMQVIYSSIPESHFYRHGLSRGKRVLKQINLQQINGILHEYLGILYYWVKRYI